MKVHLCAVWTVVLGAVALGSIRPALADTTIYRTRGNGAHATWYQYDDCSWSNVRIDVTEDVTRMTGSEQSSAVMVTASGDIYDMCYGSPNYGTQVNFFGVSQQETIVEYTSAALRSAALKVTLPVNEYGSHGVFVGSMSIDVSWIGTNAYVNSGNSTSRQVGPEGIYISRNTGVQRAATPAGTVLLDGSSVTNGFAFGELARTTNGTLTIIR